MRTRVRLPPPPPFENRQPVSPQVFSGTTGFLFPLEFNEFAPVSHLSKPVLPPPHFHHSPAFHSLFAPRFSVFSGRSPKLVRWDNSCYIKGGESIDQFGSYGNTDCDISRSRIEPPQDSGRLSRKRHAGTTSIFPASTLIWSSSFRVTTVPDFKPYSAIALVRAAISRFLVCGSAIDSQT